MKSYTLWIRRFEFVTGTRSFISFYIFIYLIFQRMKSYTLWIRILEFVKGIRSFESFYIYILFLKRNFSFHILHNCCITFYNFPFDTCTCYVFTTILYQHYIFNFTFTISYFTILLKIILHFKIFPFTISHFYSFLF